MVVRRCDGENRPMETSRRRVLIAAEPRLLAEALAAILRSAGDVVVVVPSETAPPAGGRFDVAVVTDAALRPAPVTVVLPDELGNAGTGLVHAPGGTISVYIDDADRVVELLDEHVQPVRPF